MALDALAHGDEGLGGAAHLGGAIGLEIRHGAALAETVGGPRQPFDGAHLVAQENNRYADQDQRRSHHIQRDEKVRLGNGGAVARHQHRQHAVMHLDPDLEIIAHAGDEEIAVMVDALGQDLVQRHIDGAEGRFGGRRDPKARREGDAVLQLALGQCAQAKSFRAGIIIFQRHQQRDIGGDIARQRPRGAVQIPFEKHISDDRLQQHDRER